MQVNNLPCLRIEATEWLERPDFQAFVEKYGANIGPKDGHRLATWHVSGELDEFSDVFVTYDHGEGSDALEMPADIWAAICATCEAQGIDFAVVWITHGDNTLHDPDGQPAEYSAPEPTPSRPSVQAMLLKLLRVLAGGLHATSDELILTAAEVLAEEGIDPEKVEKPDLWFMLHMFDEVKPSGEALRESVQDRLPAELVKWP